MIKLVPWAFAITLESASLLTARLSCFFSLWEPVYSLISSIHNLFLCLIHCCSSLSFSSDVSCSRWYLQLLIIWWKYSIFVYFIAWSNSCRVGCSFFSTLVFCSFWIRCELHLIVSTHLCIHMSNTLIVLASKSMSSWHTARPVGSSFWLSDLIAITWEWGYHYRIMFSSCYTLLWHPQYGSELPSVSKFSIYHVY